MELKASHSNFANRVDNLVITQLQLESGSRVVPLKTILQPPATGDSAGEINSHTKNVLYIGIAVSFCLEALKMFSSGTLPRFFRILMIEQRVKKLFFANIFLVFFSWAKLDGTGGLVASECVKQCSRVCEHGSC